MKSEDLMIWGLFSIIPPLFARRGLTGMMVLAAILFSKGIGYAAVGVFYGWCTGLPTFIAALGWCGRRGSPIWYVGNWWPLAASLLFFLHPATAMAPLYPLCWLTVPFLSFATRSWQHSVLLDAWRASITAHTIGTLLLLYTTHTSPLLWHGVQSLVLGERLMIALGMVAVVKVDEWLGQHFGYTVEG
jgi:hypothetical protein